MFYILALSALMNYMTTLPLTFPTPYKYNTTVDLSGVNIIIWEHDSIDPSTANLDLASYKKIPFVQIVNRAGCRSFHGHIHSAIPNKYRAWRWFLPRVPWSGQGLQLPVCAIRSIFSCERPGWKPQATIQFFQYHILYNHHTSNFNIFCNHNNLSNVFETYQTTINSPSNVSSVRINIFSTQHADHRTANLCVTPRERPDYFVPNHKHQSRPTDCSPFGYPLHGCEIG